MGAYEYRDEAWAYDKRNCCGRAEEQYHYVSGKTVREVDIYGERCEEDGML